MPGARKMRFTGDAPSCCELRVMDDTETTLREDIVAQCRALNASGLNQGTSGNISVRHGERMLISPSAIPYDRMTPQMIVSVALRDADGAYDGPLKPSTEWRFHRRILLERPGTAAVVHAHPAHCTALAMARRDIPACHYMIAAFGGNSVRCAGYAPYGTDALAELAMQAMAGRTACLLANHGMIAVGETLAKAMWRAVELEALARHYILSLAVGGPVLLSDEQIAETLEGFGHYGLQEDGTPSRS